MTDKGKMIEAVYKASLTKRATLVIFYLINRANKEMTCFPSVNTIAADCNMSDRTVRRAINDLVEVGFVEKEARYRENNGQSSNLYFLKVSYESKEEEQIEDVGFKNYLEVEISNHTNATDESTFKGSDKLLVDITEETPLVIINILAKQSKRASGGFSEFFIIICCIYEPQNNYIPP